MLMFDLDDFKQVNDTWSHTVGDDVLQQVAELLRSGTRPSDVCARFGGEEFVVVLTDCDRRRAGQVADELRRSIRHHDWGQLADGLVVTASIGVADLADVPDPRSLIMAADRALYRAKHAGTDQVH